MKLLLDQGLPRSAAGLLNAAGFDAVHVSDAGHSTAADSAILEFAAVEERIVVTLDADFHRLLVLTGASGPSVVRIRIEGLKAAELSALLESSLPGFAEELRKGAVVTMRPNRAGVRRLPLLS